MRVKLQLVMCNDDGQEETVTDVVTLKKDHRRIEHLGLTRATRRRAGGQTNVASPARKASSVILARLSWRSEQSTGFL